MNNLSDEHDNFPPLSLSKISDTYKKKSSHQYGMNDFSDPYLNYNDFKYTSKDIQKFRLGPVDKEGIYSPSEFSNIYLESVRYLVLCYTSLFLCLLLNHQLQKFSKHTLLFIEPKTFDLN